jgi:transposase
MPKKLYVVDLTPEERDELLSLVKRGRSPARTLTRARMLLLADEGRTDEDISEALHASRPTVERVRKRFVEGGLQWTLIDRPRKGAPRKLSGRDEAMLVALACSTPPDGRTTWTMQMLADRLVSIEVIESISDETVRRVLKKRVEALAEGAVVHPERGSRVRLPHGRPAGPVRGAV